MVQFQIIFGQHYLCMGCQLILKYFIRYYDGTIFHRVIHDFMIQGKYLNCTVL